MKVTGFDGRERPINFSKYYVYGDDTRHKSSLHRQAKKILRETFPYDIVYEEVSLPGSNKGASKILRADFFVPAQDLVVEVHGRQHYEFTIHFHKSKLDFFRSQARDKNKEEWCDLNSIKFISLKYSETEDEWREALLNT
jgi:CRISPR/Cas system-associated exonuclease Cas4 (RecB family)